MLGWARKNLLKSLFLLASSASATSTEPVLNLWRAKEDLLTSLKSDFIKARKDSIALDEEMLRHDSSKTAEEKTKLLALLEKKERSVETVQTLVLSPMLSPELLQNRPGYLREFNRNWTIYLDLSEVRGRLLRTLNNDSRGADLLSGIVNKRLAASSRFTGDSIGHQIEDILLATHLDTDRLERYVLKLDSPGVSLNFLGHNGIDLGRLPANNPSLSVGQAVQGLISGIPLNDTSKPFIDSIFYLSHLMLLGLLRTEALAEASFTDSQIMSYGFASQPVIESGSTTVPFNRTTSARNNPAIFRPLYNFLGIHWAELTDLCNVDCEVKRLDQLSQDILGVATFRSSPQHILDIADRYEKLYPDPQ